MELHNIVNNLKKNSKIIEDKNNQNIRICHLSELNNINEKNRLSLVNNTYNNLCLINQITNKKGFIVTTNSISDILRYNNIESKIEKILTKINNSNINKSSLKIIQLLRNISLPELLKVQIKNHFEELIIKKNEIIIVKISSNYNNESSNLFLKHNIISDLDEIYHSIIDAFKVDFSPESLKQKLNEENIDKNINYKSLFAIGYEVKELKNEYLKISNFNTITKEPSVFEIENNYSHTYIDLEKNKNNHYKIFKKAIIENKNGIYEENIINKSIKISSQTIHSLCNKIINIEKQIKRIYKKNLNITIYCTFKNNIIDVEEILLENIKVNNEHLSYTANKELKKSKFEGKSLNPAIKNANVVNLKSIVDATYLNENKIAIISNKNTIDYTYDPFLKNCSGIVTNFDISKNIILEKIVKKYNLTTIHNCKNIENIKNNSYLTIDSTQKTGKVFDELIKYQISHIEENSKIFKKSIILEQKEEDNNFHFNSIPKIGRIEISMFDLLKLDESLIIKEISEIAINEYPKSIWINLGSDRNNIYIKSIISESFNKTLKKEIKILTKVIDSIGCDNINIYIKNIQNPNQVEIFKDKLRNIKTKSKILNTFGIILSMGGLIRADEFKDRTISLIGIDYKELELICENDNYKAIDEYITLFLDISHKLNSNKGIINVKAKFIEDHINPKNLNSLHFIGCKTHEVIEIYSHMNRLHIEHRFNNKKHHHSKKVKID